ncbi:MAG: aminopeptidase [Nanoarchaeota archaeon]|nr:aminopeptidase [Nanoarchaeota archaeon]
MTFKNIVPNLLKNKNKEKNSNNLKNITSTKTIQTFSISPTILQRYADVMINFALHNGKGASKDDVVEIVLHESAKEFLPYLQAEVLKSGAKCLIRYLPEGISRQKYELSSNEQIEYMPDNLIKGRIKDITCTVHIISEVDKEELKGIDPKKIMLSQKHVQKYRKLLNKKEEEGKYFWTLCMFGTLQMAKEVNLSLEEYWEVIVKACYLNFKNPVEKWKKTASEIDRVKEELNNLQIQKIHVEAKDTDLWLSIGEHRQWLGGSGHNIPSFELFISPNWRGTKGHIQFTEKLYRYGNIIENIYLEFKNGLVTKATASSGEDVLKEMIAQKNANKVGEFSLTDSRLSNITKFMGETLFDENVGGKYGNTHIAVGMAYKESYTGDRSKMKESDWEKLGFNDSSVHTDIVSTSNRKVTAVLKNGEEKVIYKNGKFTI